MAGYSSSDEERVAELIYKFQVYAFPRRIRMKEFFKNFDKLGSGRCTRVQLGRGLDTAGFKIAVADVEFLADHFTQEGPNIQKPQVVNYVQLCDAVDKIFNDGDVSFKNEWEREQMGESQMLSQSMTNFQPNEVDDEEKMDHVMHRLASLCKASGHVFKYLFVDFDRGPSPSPSMMCPRRSGKCTREQFKRLFRREWKISKFPDEDLEMLCDRYSNSAGDVNFGAIHNDISEVLSPEPPPFPTSPLSLKMDPTSWDHQMLNPVKKLQSKVVEKRIRLDEYFKDFDPLRKGFCTAGQLKTVLTILDLARELDRVDFNQVVESYVREDGMFCHALFVRDIDAAFSVPGLEKEPLASTPLPDATTTAPARRNRMNLNRKQKEAVNNLEEQIKTRISQRRILMKPMFLDMDKANKGLVSKGQFGRVMGQLGWELTQEQLSTLALKYCDRGNHNDFNYVDFIKCCDPPVEAEEIAMSQLNAPYQDQAPSKYFMTGGKIKPMDRAFSPMLA